MLQYRKSEAKPWKNREKNAYYTIGTVSAVWNAKSAIWIKTKFAITAVNAWISKIMQRSKSTESSPIKRRRAIKLSAFLSVNEIVKFRNIHCGDHRVDQHSEIVKNDISFFQIFFICVIIGNRTIGNAQGAKNVIVL